MSVPTARRPAPLRRARAAGPRLSGCFLKHTVAECDCVPPGAATPDPVGCRECWGNGDHCAACGGWGETTRYGGWVHRHVAGSGATGPSTNVDPWADVIVDPWINPERADSAPF